jgi:hypothetical protein
VLDYASWIAHLSTRRIHDIAHLKLGKPLESVFRERFGTELPEALNESHSMVIVASEFDASSRRIVEYLAEVHDIAINTAFFSVFEHNGETLLATDWLLDQEEVTQRAESKAKAPWSGLWYYNVGQDNERNWEDMRKYAFIAAGGSRYYSASRQKALAAFRHAAVEMFAGSWRTVVLLILCASSCFAQSPKDTLRQGFEMPPESARPRVWWHWMNGNITQEGIKLDIEWMHRVGLGGFQNFDASMATPQVVKSRLAYMSPEWKGAFRYATNLADNLGMEEAIAGSPGFSETGGPWVGAKEAMKKYVWSEIRVEGGKPFTGVLPHPPSNTGAFQNLSIEDVGSLSTGPFHAPEYYADSAVVAFRQAKTDVPLPDLHPIITSSSPIDVSLLSDGDLKNTTTLALPEDNGKGWIQYSFPQPRTIRSVTMVAGKRNLFDLYFRVERPSGIELESSDDGQSFQKVIDLPQGGSTENTISFDPVTAKYFRVTFAPTVPSINTSGVLTGESQRRREVHIAELELHPGARVNRFEEKAGFNTLRDLYAYATPGFGQQDAINKNDIVDLTSRMQADGAMDWTPPPGDWVIVRFGYSLLGITNHPASKEATGLEVDKLNGQYVRNYVNRYLDMYESAVGPGMVGKRGVRYMVNDSWEAGSQNWTDNMLEQFVRLRGYDPHPWLPVLTGRIVDSTQASDKFLWDFRKTIADLTAEQHYGQLAAALKARGIGHYSEAEEDDRAFIVDGMEAKKYADIPMGADWVQTPGVDNVQYRYDADDRESASVAHIYGQNIAATETFTTCNSSVAWAWSPATLKPTADQVFLNGINRIVIHVSAHQPLLDKVPGMTFGPCGQNFTRNETWAEEAAPWITYLARTSWLLQQGQFVADIAYFYGEDSNLSAIFHDSAPNVPSGYDFDYVNPDVLIHELKVSNGKLVTRSGMSYGVLVLDKYSRHMSLPVLRAIDRLVEEGAIVVGEKPIATPSLADDASAFKELNDELFGVEPGVHAVGKGKVYTGTDDLESVLQTLKISPDVDYASPDRSKAIEFIHRRLSSGDLYFIDNRSDHEASVDATFRVSGRAPEFWYSETGNTVPASFGIADGRTTVPLHLEPWGTVFVIFRKQTHKDSLLLAQTNEVRLAILDGPWELKFQPNRGAPASVTLDKLISWSDSPDKGIKYFSGEGTYTYDIDASAGWVKKGDKIWLDLGDVRNLATVSLNGKELGTVWHAPYRIDATPAFRPGRNQLSIRVFNSWVNRMIGDSQPDATTKYSFTTYRSYGARSPLSASGMLGPVVVTREGTQ